MTSSKAFVDTTVFTDAVLKPTGKGKIARASLSSFSATLLPVYAIKEFKAGPLRYYVLAHNYLSSTRSFADTLSAIQALSRTPQRNTTSTTLESLAEAAAGTLKGKVTNASLVKTYGPKASPDETLADVFRLAIKVTVFNAWDERRTITTDVVQELACYEESDPYENRGLLVLNDKKCSATQDCSLSASIRKKNADIKTLCKVLKDESKKNENVKRGKILHEISRKPRASVPEEYCIGLGDAYFALYCPADATILTTNLKDHLPLAEALGKVAVRPKA